MGFAELLRRGREALQAGGAAAIELNCDLRDSQGVRTSNTVALGAWLRAQRMYDLVGLRNSDEIRQLLANYLVSRFRSEREVCRAEGRAVQARQDFEARFVNDAAAIAMGLLLVANPRMPTLRLSYEFLLFLREELRTRRIDCLGYLTGVLGIAPNIAGDICGALGGLVNPPPVSGYSRTVPEGFPYNDAFIRLARRAFGVLIQPPATPMVMRLPSIQIAPPMR
jgi:hypothetical protein